MSKQAKQPKQSKHEIHPSLLRLHPLSTNVFAHGLLRPHTQSLLLEVQHGLLKDGGRNYQVRIVLFLPSPHSYSIRLTLALQLLVGALTLGLHGAFLPNPISICGFGFAARYPDIDAYIKSTLIIHGA